MKLLIVNDHMNIGGIRQSLLNLLENIKNYNYEIDIQLLRYDTKIVDEYKNIYDNVNFCKPLFLLNTYYTPYSTIKEDGNIVKWILKLFLKTLEKILGRKRLIKLLILLEKESKKYDTAISYSNDIWGSHVGGFYGGCNDYVIKKASANNKIGWIHNDANKLGLTYEICKETYNKFDTIVNVSYACKKIFDDIIPEYEYKSKVVYNMFDIEKIHRLADSENPYKKDGVRIVTVARLDNQQKRIDRIIRCCEKLKLEGIDNFQWYIVGEGPDRKWLESLSKEKGTNNVVYFEGLKENPYPYMKHADIFVLTSDYEAYGMVLTESLITGTPVISTNFSAAKEVINNNGIIVEMDEESIFKAVKMVIQERYLIKELELMMKSNRISNEVPIKQFIDVLGEC